ncbi:hypothetical protein AGMMS49546_38240 [Spirochaetia bacterium]|nr:hypothetical protein AGMMS49546_38240 [Spirochaetia bacterium]
MKLRRKTVLLPAQKVLTAALFCIIIFICNSCRTINRTAGQIPLPDRTVVFTFDDGPNAHGDTTARLLDVLKKHHIRGMFALLGENAEHNPELVKRIHHEGHYLINHGYSDTWAASLKDEEFRINLEKGEAAITAALGKELNPRFYRPQGGYYKKGQQKIWQEAGYTLAPATARVYDAVLTESGKDRAVKELVSIIERQGGGIIILHDARDSHVLMEAKLAKKSEGVFNRTWIPGAVEEIIILLEEKGYRLRDFDIPRLLSVQSESYD